MKKSSIIAAAWVNVAILIVVVAWCSKTDFRVKHDAVLHNDYLEKWMNMSDGFQGYHFQS